MTLPSSKATADDLYSQVGMLINRRGTGVVSANKDAVFNSSHRSAGLAPVAVMLIAASLSC